MIVTRSRLESHTGLEYGKNSCMKVVKVTTKGQVTIPAELRAALAIDQGTYLEVSEDGDEIRLRKVVPARPLSGDDPIWNLIGVEESGYKDVAEGTRPSSRGRGDRTLARVLVDTSALASAGRWRSTRIFDSMASI